MGREYTASKFYRVLSPLKGWRRGKCVKRVYALVRGEGLLIVC